MIECCGTLVLGPQGCWGWWLVLCLQCVGSRVSHGSALEVPWSEEGSHYVGSTEYGPEGGLYYYVSTATYHYYHGTGD